MTDREEPANGAFSHPEKVPSEKEVTPGDTERLRLIGEFFTNASSLIERIHDKQLADDITYQLIFPIMPEAPTIIPQAAAGFDDLSTIEVHAGYSRQAAAAIDDDKSHEDISASSMRIVITSPTKELMISRASSTAPTVEPATDTVLDTIQRRSEGSLRDELRFESDEEFSGRLLSVTAVPQSEINALLLSLAIPENYGDVLYTAKEKNLMEDSTFLWLLESLRQQTLTANTSGHYEFRNKSGARLFFHRSNDENTVMLTYSNPETGEPLVAYVDTTNGIRVDFTTTDETSILKQQPTNKDIAGLNQVIVDELNHLSGDEVHGDIYADADPESIVEDILTEQEETLDNLRRQIDEIDLD